MRRVLAALAALGVLAGACTTAEGEPRPEATAAAPAVPDPSPSDPAVPDPAVPDPSPTGSAGPTAPDASGPEPSAEAPEPEARVPRDPRRLAEVLTETWRERRGSIDAWVASGGSSEWPAPEALELLVLFEQRIYRTLAGDPRLARRVLERLPPGLAVEARLNVGAGSTLANHFQPVREVPDFRIRPPEPAETLLRSFRAAQARFDVDWELLAAVMLIETRMGRIVSRSSAGAQGPMQFLPATWEAYGLGGDVHDERDAVFGAANYLRASGAPGDVRQALYRYNPVNAYVSAVSRYTKAMERDPETFYAYYHWQVFVRTTRGDVRLSGPGLPPNDG